MEVGRIMKMVLEWRYYQYNYGFIHSSIFIVPDTYSQIIKKREWIRLLSGEGLMDKLMNDDEPNASPVFCRGYLNRVIVAANVSWRGDDDCLLCTVCGLLRPVSWLGNYTICVIAAMSGDADCLQCTVCGLLRPVSWLGNYTTCMITAMSGVWCQRARQDHGLHELIIMSANTTRYRISCNDLTVLRLIAARRLYHLSCYSCALQHVDSIMWRLMERKFNICLQSDRKRPDAYCSWQTGIKRFYCPMVATAQLSYIFN
ncbi:hypothetical protein Tco_0453207, partial [Tanacetum coccineum]